MTSSLFVAAGFESPLGLKSLSHRSPIETEKLPEEFLRVRRGFTGIESGTAKMHFALRFDRNSSYNYSIV
jgi:hypothetical protein